MTAPITVEDTWTGQPMRMVSQYLTYHEITTVAPRYLYAVSAAQFKEHMICLQTMVISRQKSKRSCHITFDDGHLSQYLYALPILQENGLKAIFFVTAGWSGSRQGYMSWEQLRELRQCGHEVQSHGWSHALLTQCSKESLKEELGRSKAQLEDHLGAAVDAISMPGGRWNKAVLQACKEAGYLRVFTSDPWITPEIRQGVQTTGRWMVTRSLRGERIPSLLEGRAANIYVLRARHFAKASVRWLLGDNAYQSMWRSLFHKEDNLESSEENTNSLLG